MVINQPGDGVVIKKAMKVVKKVAKIQVKTITFFHNSKNRPSSNTKVAFNNLSYLVCFLSSNYK